MLISVAKILNLNNASGCQDFICISLIYGIYQASMLWHILVETADPDLIQIIKKTRL